MLTWDEYAAHLPEIGVDEQCVLASFAFGSRACGLHTPQSDHDLVLIVEDGTDALPQPADWLECVAAGGSINFNLYSRRVWIERAARNELQVFMALACPLMERWHHQPAIVLPRLKLCVSQEASRHFRSLARRFWAVNELKARKCVFYGLRDWVLGEQVARHGHIVHADAANALHETVMSAPATSLADLYVQFEPHYERVSCGSACMSPARFFC